MKCNDISSVEHPSAPYPAETELSFDVEQPAKALSTILIK